MDLCPTLTSWSIATPRRVQHDTRGILHEKALLGLALQKLHEPEPGAVAVRALAGLELVRDRLDDRDPEPALGEVVLQGPVAGGLEAGTVVRHLDDEPVGQELVHDLDRSLAISVAVS